MIEAKHTPTPYRRGELLLTRTTERWSPEAREVTDREERTCIYANFHNGDEGRSRQRILTMNTAIPDWIETRDFIVTACNAHDELVNAVRQSSKYIEELLRYVAEERIDSPRSLHIVGVLEEALAAAGVKV